MEGSGEGTDGGATSLVRLYGVRNPSAFAVLAEPGADFSRLDPREDRLHQNALMAWLNLREWDICTLLLQRGLSPDYVAPDGRSAWSVLAEVDPPGSAYTPADSVARERLLKRSACDVLVVALRSCGTSPEC